MKNTVMFAMIILLITACSRKKEVSKNDKNNKCSYEAIVKDFSNLDGCQFLIVMPNGDRLLPTKLPENGFEFKDNQKIKFGFHPIKDVMSICMAEKLAVEITCIQELENTGIPIKPECHNTDQPTSVDWMDALIKKYKPKKIVKYGYLGDGYAYWFKTADEKNYLYDCQGTFLCETGSDVMGCKYKIDDPSKGVTIWQRSY